MSEFNVNVNVNAPALEQAINNLAAALRGGKNGLPENNAAMQAAPVNASTAPMQATQPTAPGAVQPTMQAPAEDPMPAGTGTAAPTNTQAVTGVGQIAAASPFNAPNPAVSQPQFGATPPQSGVTLDAIINAGASLIEKGMMAQVVALLGKYGLQAVNQLQPAQYAPFAAELQALGAAI